MFRDVSRKITKESESPFRFARGRAYAQFFFSIGRCWDFCGGLTLVRRNAIIKAKRFAREDYAR